MFPLLKTATLAAVLSAASWGASVAATIPVANDISIGDFIVTPNQVLAKGDRVEFTFTALEDLVIEDPALSIIGSSSGNDINNTQYGIIPGAGVNFVSTSGGTNRSVSANVPGLSLLTGQSFTIFFDEEVDGQNLRDVRVAVAVSAIAPSPIPLPASGMLLIAAIGAGAMLRRKRRV